MIPGEDELARLVQWDGCGVEGLDWPYIESELGARLPTEYKALVERFPHGRFNGALEVLQPRSAEPGDVERYLDDLFDEAALLREPLSFNNDLPREAFPDVPGLFPWAGVEGEYTICWYFTGSPEAVSTNYVVRKPYGPCIRLDGSITQSLMRMISGDVLQVSGLLSTDQPPSFVEAPRYPRRTPRRASELRWMTRMPDWQLVEPVDAVDSILALGVDTRDTQVVDWPAVETSLGRRLPSDYKRFIERVGPGQYGNIVVASPTHATAEIPAVHDLLTDLRDWLAERYVDPPPVAPEPGGLLLWGRAPRGWVCGLSEVSGGWRAV